MSNQPTSHGRLSERVAIVTGASRGIGAAAAEGFAREGASVVVSSFPSVEMDDLADEVVTRIETAGGRAIRVSADVTDPAQVKQLVASTIDEFGSLDILVNNAAFSRRSPFNEISVEQWDQTMAVNLRGTFLCSQAAHPHLVERGGGSIINLTSVTANLGMAGVLDYVTSKAGIIGLTRALAREIGSDNIRVNAVMPGGIRTEHEVELFPNADELAAELAEKQSIPRRGYAEDLVGTFLYLASDDSTFVTGQVFPVDGGWIHH